MKTATLNWTPLPDALPEEQVNLRLTWTADVPTTRAIKRQARLMGFKSPRAYLEQALAAVLAGNEQSTIVTREGEFIDFGTVQ